MNYMVAFDSHLAPGPITSPVVTHPHTPSAVHPISPQESTISCQACIVVN
jgi:hypothetical protein